jgi:TolA-binding protein
MTDVETLSERLRTVERAVTEGDHTFPEVDDIAELTERLEAVEQRLDELDERTTELEGATQALRGYVGNVRSVNERVEQRADTALAATERLERRLDAAPESPDPEAGSRQHADTDPRPSTDQPGATGERSDGTADHATGADGPADTTEFEFGGEDTERATDDEDTDPGVLERIRSHL